MVWRTTITIIPDLVVPARNREVIGVIAHESFTGSTHQDFPGRFRRSLHGYRVTLHFGDVATVTEVVVGCEFGGARFVVPSASWVSRVMSVHPIWPSWSAYWVLCVSNSNMSVMEGCGLMVGWGVRSGLGGQGWDHWRGEVRLDQASNFIVITVDDAITSGWRWNTLSVSTSELVGITRLAWTATGGHIHNFCLTTSTGWAALRNTSEFSTVALAGLARVCCDNVRFHDDFVLVLTGAVCFLHTVQSVTV